MLSESMSKIAFTIIDLILKIVLNSAIIWFLSKRFKFKTQDYKPALITSLPISIFGVLLEAFIKKYFFIAVRFSLLLYLLYFIVVSVLIKFLYKESWKKSFLVALVWLIIIFVLSFLMGALVLTFI